MPVTVTQAKGSAGQTIWDFETVAFNCLNDAADRKPFNVAFNSNDIALSRALNQAETIRGDRNPAPPFQGNKDVSGALVVPVSFLNSGLFYKAAIGLVSSTDIPATGNERTAGGTVGIIAGGTATFSVPQTALLLGDRIRVTYTDGTVVEGYITTRTSDVSMVIKLDRDAVSDLPSLPQTGATVNHGFENKLASAPGVTFDITSGVATFSAAQATAAVGDMITYGANTGRAFITGVTSTTVFTVVTSLGFTHSPDVPGATPVDSIEPRPKFRHLFKIDPTAELPSATIARGFRDLSPEIWQFYTGCKINQLSMDLGGDGELLQTLDVIGGDEVASSTPYDDSPSPAALELALDRFEQFDITAEEGGSAVEVLKTANVTLNNNLDPDSFTIGGGGTRAALPEGIAGVSGNITALFVDDAILTKAQGNVTSSLKFIFTGPSDNALEIFIPELKFQQNSPSIPGPAGVELALDFQGFFSTSVEESGIQFTLTNDQPTY